MSKLLQIIVVGNKFPDSYLLFPTIKILLLCKFYIPKIYPKPKLTASAFNMAKTYLVNTATAIHKLILLFSQQNFVSLQT